MRVRIPAKNPDIAKVSASRTVTSSVPCSSSPLPFRPSHCFCQFYDYFFVAMDKLDSVALIPVLSVKFLNC